MTDTKAEVSDVQHRQSHAEKRTANKLREGRSARQHDGTTMPMRSRETGQWQVEQKNERHQNQAGLKKMPATRRSRLATRSGLQHTPVAHS